MIAPAKLNLCLYLGPRRGDGLHELVSIFQPLDLGDRVEFEPAERDSVICPGVEGPNLAEQALGALRDAGWDGPPTRVEIEKRIPVAAGLGGGSADAAAVLNLARGSSIHLHGLAAALGSDVPSQLNPRTALVSGAGELIEPLPPQPGYGIALIRDDTGLTAAEVYAEADRLGLARAPEELRRLADTLREAFGEPDPRSAVELASLLANDLGDAALSLRPELADRITLLERAGASRALVTGSGPTVFGLFEDRRAAGEAIERLPEELRSRATVTGPLGG